MDHNGAFFRVQTLEKSCFYPGSSFSLPWRQITVVAAEMPPLMEYITAPSLRCSFSDFTGYTSVHERGAFV